MKKIMSIFITVVLVVSSLSINVNAIGSNDRFDDLRERWVTFATGGETFDVNNQDYKEKLSNLSKVAKESWDSMLKGEDRDRLWQEFALHTKDNSASNQIQFTYQRLEPMATAYATRGTTLYHNQELKKDIIDALDFMYEKYYNENIPKDAGKYPYGNWFGWVIGNPMALMATTMLMYDDLTPTQITNYANASMAFKDWVGDGDRSANGIWRRKCDLYVAIATKNADLMDKVKRLYPIYIDYVTGGEGYYKDGTFIAHGNHLYNGGYGAGMFRDQVELIFYLAGSDWDLMSLDLSNVYRFAYDSYIPFFSNGLFMDLTKGRDITRLGGEFETGRQLLVTLLRLASIAKEEDKVKINGYLKRWFKNEQINDFFNKNSNIYDINLKNQLINDNNMKASQQEQFYKQYTVGDSAVVHSPKGYSAGLAMHSTRIYAYETGDSNTKGWHTRNGRLYLYTDDLNQNDDSMKATVDWRRLPGTTVANGSNASPNIGVAGSYAGGVDMNNQYGTSAIKLIPNNNTLEANKSYFMFDDEIVALGSGINGKVADKTIETIIENYKLDGDGNQELIVNDKKQDMPIESNLSLDNTQWLWRQGNTKGSNLGVYFPNQTSLKAIKETRSGKLSDLGSYNVGLDDIYKNNYLTIYQDHGKNQTDGSYAYVLLPNSSANETKAYSQKSDIEILKQDKQMHAVYEKNLNMVGVNQFVNEKTTLDAFGIKNYLSVNKASSVMLEESGQKLSMSISDITQQNNGMIDVIINRNASSIISKDERVEVVALGPYIHLRINTKDSKGTAIKAEFSFEEVTSKPEKAQVTSHEFDGKNIQIQFDNAKYATGYSLKYGTVSGTYTNTIDLGLNTKATLKDGLEEGQKYYFVVEARNDLGTILSDEFSQVFGEEKPYRTYSESFNDFTKYYQSTGQWNLEKIKLGDIGRQDDSLFKRGDAENATLTYAVEGMTGFDLLAYKTGYSGNENINITFEVSKDNINYEEVSPKNTNEYVSGIQFYKDYYEIDNLKEGIKYLKIKINAGGHIWAPQLSQLNIHYQKDLDISKLENIEFRNNITDVGAGETKAIEYAMNPSNATNYTLDWESSNPAVAKVDNGIAIGVSQGTVDITVKDEHGKVLGQTKVKVTNPNIALQAKATASDEASANKAINVNDGDENTRWGTNKIGTKQDQWIRLDLGEETEISNISLKWESSYAVQYTLEVSNSENGPWTSIQTITNGTGGLEQFTFDQTKTKARYVRMHGTKSKSEWGYSIFEFKVLGVQQKKELEKIELTPNNITLLTGEESQINFILTPMNPADKTITWTSDNEDIVTVDKNGHIKAISGGKTKVKATQGSIQGECEIEVIDVSKPPVLVSEIKLNTKDMSLDVGKNFKVEANVLPTNATNQNLLYSSSDPSVATIGRTGNIQALKAGKTTITVENKASSLKVTFELTVEEPVIHIPATSLEINTNDRNMVIGEAFQIVPIILPANATNKLVTYQSSDAKVVSVDDEGLMIAHKSGIVTITVSNTANQLVKTFKVEVKEQVKDVLVSKISLNKTNIKLNTNDTFELKATLTPDNVTKKQIIYTSSRTNVATVSETGKITAIQPGKATITVKDLITGIYVTCEVIVENPKEVIVNEIDQIINSLKDTPSLTNEQKQQVIHLKQRLDKMSSVKLTDKQIETMDNLLYKALGDNLKTTIDNQLNQVSGLTIKGLALGIDLSQKDLSTKLNINMTIALATDNKINTRIKEIGNKNHIQLLHMFDMNLLLDNQEITELKTPAIISMDRPTDIPKNAKIKVLRYHDGIVSILDVVENQDKISFQTDRFSTYAIGYVQSDDSNNTVKTNDMSSFGLPVCLLAISLVVIKQLNKRKED